MRRISIVFFQTFGIALFVGSMAIGDNSAMADLIEVESDLIGVRCKGINTCALVPGTACPPDGSVCLGLVVFGSCQCQ